MSILNSAGQPTQNLIRSFQYFLAKPRLFNRLWRKFLSLFFVEQWIILIAANTLGDTPVWEDFKPLLPPPGLSWADPFPWVHEGQHYIFVEELPRSTNRGYISCLRLDEKYNIESSTVVLQKPYHLSYPHLFSYGGELYMMPESKENCSIDLYRCIEFPDCWQFEKTLVQNISALDATLFEQNGHWWLFTIIEEGTNRDALHLYHADSPLSEEWNPHPGNPVVRDAKSARPAGRVFSRNGKLYRPSQDCSVRYGYAININEITELSEWKYSEIQGHIFHPPSGRNIQGTHTWNETPDIKVIDAILRRRRF